MRLTWALVGAIDSNLDKIESHLTELYNSSVQPSSWLLSFTLLLLL